MVVVVVVVGGGGGGGGKSLGRYIPLRFVVVVVVGGGDLVRRRGTQQHTNSLSKLCACAAVYSYTHKVRSQPQMNTKVLFSAYILFYKLVNFLIDTV